MNYVVKSLSKLRLEYHLPLFFDTETIGLYGEIALVQFYQEGLEYPILCVKPDPHELAKILSKYEIVGQNIHYDISTVQKQTGSKWQPSTFDDTLYLSRIHWPKEQKFDLESLAILALGYSPYAELDIDKKKMQKTDWSVNLLDPVYSKQLEYAAIDVTALKAIYDKVKLNKDNYLYQLDKKILQCCLEFQNNGMYVDKVIANKQMESNLQNIERIGLPINSNSYKQVREYLDSTESDAIALIKFGLAGDKRAKDVLKTRKLIKQNSFIEKFITSDSRIYGKFQPSARSGRFTCKDQNLQQNPRKLKHLFTAPKDKVLIYADYAQIELRSITVIAGEERMAELFRSGEDLHAFTALMLFGKKFTKEQRFIAKTFNFGLLYGAGAKVIIDILLRGDEPLVMTEGEAWRLINKWKNLWPSIHRWQKAGIRAWENGNTWSTPLGRKYIGNRMTDHLNICNQGFAAEVAKLAMHKMYLKSAQLGGKLVNFVHDSYIFEAANNPEIYKPIANAVAVAMQEAWFASLASAKGLRITSLPMPVDVFVGNNLATIEDDYKYKFVLEGEKYNDAT